jgi:hypothetical protein
MLQIAYQFNIRQLKADFTEIWKLKIHLSMIVGAERSFSCIKRLKKWLSNSMGQVRISDVWPLQVESETIIDEWQFALQVANSGSKHRLQLSNIL